MNSINLITERILILCFLLALSTSTYAQKINFSAIESVVNVDSLEKHLTPQQPQKYVEQLLTLEHSHRRNGHDKFGTTLSTIGALAQQQKWTNATATYLLFQGRLLVKKRQLIQASTTFIQALKTFQKGGDTLGIIRTYIELSDLNVNQMQEKFRNLSTGTEYANKAIELAEKKGDDTALLMALGSLAVVYSYDKQNLKLQKSITLKQLSIIERNAILESYRTSIANNLAGIYFKEGNIPKAYEMAKQIKERFHRELPPYKYTMLLINLAFFSKSLNKNDEAKSYLDELLVIIRLSEKRQNNEYRVVKQAAFEGYREIFMKKKDFKNALLYADSANLLKDLMYTEENVQKLNQLEVTYRTKEIKTQNALLVKENELVKSRNQVALIGLALVLLLVSSLLVALYYFNKSKKVAQRQASEMAKLSNIRDQYVRIIAHDIRSPLLAVHNMHQTLNTAIRLKSYNDIETISKYIDETGVNIVRFLDNLLNWGMSQQEEISFHPQKINLAEILQEVVAIYDPIKKFKHFHVLIENVEGVFVYADFEGLKLILRNLIDNAIKNLPATDGEIVITATKNEIPKNVVLTIKDNGKGINEEKRAIINEVFRSPNVVQAGQEKLGMGTMLISKFVQRNKGSIVAQQNSDQGSSFVLTLPLETN